MSHYDSLVAVWRSLDVGEVVGGSRRGGEVVGGSRRGDEVVVRVKRPTNESL